MSPACGHCGQLHESHVTMCPVTGARLGNATYTMTNEDEVLVGNVIGERYDVRDILGQGGSGTVFGVVHMQFVRTFAMKVLRPRYTSIDAVQRIFHGEARAAFSVAHPSLCEIFDVGTLPDGAPFFVMERLEGDTLASRLGKERFSAAAAVDLMMQLLAAMDAIHSRELVLRDLRPQNIFLSHRRGCRPVVKVLDFGLARLVPLERVQKDWDALRAVAAPNDTSGSLSIPYYLSPERTRGEHGVDAASDIFAAGVIFYEALTAQKPFNGPTWSALVGQIQHAQPTPLAVLRPDVPAELSALVTRALSAKPRSRPASAKEMQDELRAAFEGPRRGSASMRSMPVSSVDSTAHTPVRASTGNLPAFSLPASASAHAPPSGPVSRTAPPSGAHVTERPRASAPEELYDDETSTDTDRKTIDTIIAVRDAAAASRQTGQAGLHGGHHASAARVPDEASADHPVRTVRPPSIADMGDLGAIDVIVEPDAPATSRGGDLATALGLSSKIEEDEETETMQLTPEVRARIEQMTTSARAPIAAAPAPTPANAVEDSNRPPPTRRLTKPTTRR